MSTRVRVGVAAVALAVAGGGGPVPASAMPGATSGEIAAPARANATTTTVVSRTFTSRTRVWSKRFNACLWMSFSGRMSATRYRYPASEGPFWVIDLKKPKVSDPRVTVTLRRTCKDGAALKRRHTADTVRYAGYMYGYKCDYDPSYSVSVPWGVSVGATPDCGDERVAAYGDSQKRARGAHTFRLRSDGVAVGWDGRDWVHEGYDTAKVCTSISGFFVLRDTQGSVRAKHVVKAALKDQCVTAS